MTRPTCETCVFWDKPEYPVPFRPQPCRRYPPYDGAQWGKAAGYCRPVWPLTFSEDWCGEHQPKPSP
jgi:hypothetical protein